MKKKFVYSVLVISLFLLFTITFKASDLKTRQEHINDWYTTLKNQVGETFEEGKGYSAILFDEDLTPIDYDRVGTMGNPIYVGIIRNVTKEEKITVGFDPCSLEPEGPIIYKSEKIKLPEDTAVKNNPSLMASQTYYKLIIRSAICYNPSVTIRVKKVDENGNELTGDFVLKQYRRYHATLQVGVIFSKYNEINYGILTDEDGKNIIYNKGPEDKGPQYTLSLVFYALPRNLQSLFSKKYRFKGRDIVNDQKWQDRLGAVIGVGLKKPFNRFYAGLSFEIMKGINIIGVWEFAKIKQLANGLEEGDEFHGTILSKEEDPDLGIPISYKWKMFSKIILGISIDLRYFNILSSR